MHAIYSVGYENIEANKPYHHAKILHAGSFPIESYLNTILCRNNVERMTLLNLLKEKNPLAYAKNRDRIKVYRHDTFENNGLYITECLYHQNTVSISFSDTYSKLQYAERMKRRFEADTLKPIKVKVELCWFNARSVISRSELVSFVEYEHSIPLSITKLPDVAQAKSIGIKVYFEERLMCYTIQSLEDSEVIK